jgi:hypothetical protein
MEGLAAAARHGVRGELDGCVRVPPTVSGKVELMPVLAGAEALRGVPFLPVPEAHASGYR